MPTANVHSILSDLAQLAQDIRVYRERAAQVLVGANNLISFNPDAPSNAALQQEIIVYSRVVNTADTALTALAALAALAAIGYPDLPIVAVSTEAWTDLGQDMAVNQSALDVMSVAGAVGVSSTVGTESPATGDKDQTP